MRGRCLAERGITAQSCPVSGRDRTASRTTVPPILLAQNRHPRRRWRGRFAVLDPARSLPGDASCLRRSGGKHDNSAAYRRASGRTAMERRCRRDPQDRGRTEGRPGRTRPTRETRLSLYTQRRREASLPSAGIAGGSGRIWGREGGMGGRGRGGSGRQDKRNGAMPCGPACLSPCLHIVFSGSGHGATYRLMAPWLAQHTETKRFSMAPWPLQDALAAERPGHG